MTQSRFTLPWIEMASAFLGVEEIPGPKNNKQILQFLQSISSNVSSEETPWCAAWVGYVLARCDIKGTNSLMARSYERWGKKLDKFVPGCIVTRYRGEKSAGLGHVGFGIKQVDAMTYYLGGNQEDSVNITPYSTSKNTSYVWPAGYKVTPLSSEEISLLMKVAKEKSGSVT